MSKETDWDKPVVAEVFLNLFKQLEKGTKLCIAWWSSVPIIPISKVIYVDLIDKGYRTEDGKYHREYPTHEYDADQVHINSVLHYVKQGEDKIKTIQLRRVRGVILGWDKDFYR